MTPARFEDGAETFDRWRHSVVTGERPVVWVAGAGELATIPLGPNLVTMIGGSPGAGKSALVGQLVCDALRLNPELRVAWVSVEMAPGVLLDRQAARLSGIPASTIRHRRFGAEHAPRLDAAFSTLGELMPRVAFVEPPYDLGNIASTAEVFGAGLLVVDYIQRITVHGDDSDPRQRATRVMDALRIFARAGVGSLVVAALSRTKDARGRSSYDGDGLGLASFRDSSELEFGADCAALLLPDSGDPAGPDVVLRIPKERHGEAPRDIHLRFDRAHQAFADVAPPARVPAPSRAERGRMLEALRQAWGPAADADTPADRRGDDGG